MRGASSPNAPIPAGWDDWLEARGPEASFLQTTEWARIDHELNGLTAHVATVTDTDGRWAAGALLRRRVISPGRRGRMLGRRAVVELVADGAPVLSTGCVPDLLAAALEQIGQLARQLRADRVSLTPASTARWRDDPAVPGVFTGAGYRAEPWLTALVDLRRDDDELLRSFDRAARKAVRRADEAGVRVVECADRDAFVRRFFEPYHEPGAIDPGRARIWDLDTHRRYRWFVALGPDDAVHATLGTYRFGGVATEIMSSRTGAGRAAGTPAQDRLHWEAFRAHRDAGDTTFDLAGFSPEPRDGAEAGIRRFKEKWGGRVAPNARYELAVHGAGRR